MRGWTVEDAVRIVLLVPIALTVMSFAIRPMSVNIPRRFRGKDPLPWRTIRRARLSRIELRQAGPVELEADRQLWRQIEWERHLYYTDISARGFTWSREYCPQHRRHCLNTGGPHPPGGNDPSPVPDDFDPDATPMADRARGAGKRYRSVPRRGKLRRIRYW